MDSELSRRFSTEESWITEKHLKNIKYLCQGNENQNYFEIPSYTYQMAKINNTSISSRWRGCGASLSIAGGGQTSTATMESNTVYPQKNWNPSTSKHS